MKKNKIEGIHFQPWIGKNYYNSKFGKLLLLGESHYVDEDGDYVEGYPNLTNEMVKKFLTGELLRTRFFSNTGSILNSTDCRTPWYDVAFANAIQICLYDAKSQPPPEDIATINNAFKIFVSQLKPSKVLILSKRLWELWLPQDNWIHFKNVKKGEKESQIWKYEHDGSECLCMGIHHPSSRGFSPKSWKPLVDEFVNLHY